MIIGADSRENRQERPRDSERSNPVEITELHPHLHVLPGCDDTDLRKEELIMA